MKGLISLNYSSSLDESPRKKKLKALCEEYRVVLLFFKYKESRWFQDTGLEGILERSERQYVVPVLVDGYYKYAGHFSSISKASEFRNQLSFIPED